MPRATPTPAQNLLSSVILPALTLPLLPVSLAAVVLCVIRAKLRGDVTGQVTRKSSKAEKESKGCVIISGGRMTKGLTLARAFKRAGWEVIGVEEEGWGELCPMRFSSSVSTFHLLPPASASYTAYSSRLLSIALQHRATLFIPVSGAGSSVEDAQAAEEMFDKTNGRCRTFIQDPETMLDLHDKDRFVGLVGRLGMDVPDGRMVKSVEEAMSFLSETTDTILTTNSSGSTASPGREPKYVLKCMGLDENRGDMTLFPLAGDDAELSRTRRTLDGLRLGISAKCPYVFQEFIPGQEWCTHASVIDGQITGFVTCPSNDMLMTYENATTSPIGIMAEEWTRTLLSQLLTDPTASGKTRRLTGHFSFDLISSTKPGHGGRLYPIECNARCHTAVIMLPLDGIASCYATEPVRSTPLRPVEGTRPRSWIYNDLVMRYLPRLIPLPSLLNWIHPSLPACVPSGNISGPAIKPSDSPWTVRIDPSLVADDPLPFVVLWHVWWPVMLVTRWWKGKKWTRLNVSTGRIFEC